LAIEWAEAWPRLPENATIGLFLELSADAFEQWDNAQSLEEARERWKTSWMHYPKPLERTRYLDWFWASLRRPGQARHPAARDAFAPVQLVSFEMVGSGTWTHLLLGGLNERLVPAPARETAYLLPDAAHRHLSRNLVQGPQGEGQDILRSNCGFLLEENERRALLSGALFDAIASTTDCIELFATYAPEGTDRTATVLSEFYQRLYRAAMGREADFPTPEKTTILPSSSESGVGALPLQSTSLAYEKRFAPTTPFDAYSFSYSEPPSAPLTLGARQWEALLKRPAAVWLESIAHLQLRDDFSKPVELNLFRGAAVHRLLRRSGPEKWFALKNEEASWPDSVRTQSEGWKQLVEQASVTTAIPVSPQWRELWGWTRQKALALAELVSHEAPGQYLATEYTLPDGARWTNAAGDFITLRGRIDALLVDQHENPKTAFVIDFKTGGDEALKVKKLAEGNGLQLVLYGGALTDLWQCPVALTLVKPGDQAVEAQLSLAAGEDPSGLLSALARVGQTGCIGFGGRIRSDYAYVGEYPLAFIAPPSQIVVEKWILTHGECLPLPKGTQD
jgi:hypothetical protein